jgi:toxin ParE1/3/4
MPDYELSPDAEDDLSAIAAYTIATWSALQSDRYEVALMACFEALASGGARTRQPIPHRPEIVVCRCEHHYVFALRRQDAPILILAVLHENMDLIARLRDRLGE